MVVFKFNPAETGLRKTLREYQEIALRYIWDMGDKGAGSFKTWENVNRELGAEKSISRASIINFLNRMVDEGVLGFRDATGKGGHHRIYITKLDESGYKKHIVKTLLDSVARDFPKETEEVLQAL
jgi:predicted transcriptional regulator